LQEYLPIKYQTRQQIYFLVSSMQFDVEKFCGVIQLKQVRTHVEK